MKTKTEQLDFISKWSMGDYSLNEVFKAHSKIVSENFKELTQNNFLKSLSNFDNQTKYAILQNFLILGLYKDSEIINGDLGKMMQIIDYISKLDDRFKYQSLAETFKDAKTWTEVFKEVDSSLIHKLRLEFKDSIELILFIDDNENYSIGVEEYCSEKNLDIENFFKTTKVFGILTTSFRLYDEVKEDNEDRSFMIEEFGLLYLSALIIQDFEFLVDGIFSICEKIKMENDNEVLGEKVQ